MADTVSAGNGIVKPDDRWRDNVCSMDTLERGEAYYHDDNVVNCRFTNLNNRFILRALVRSKTIRCLYMTQITFDREGMILSHECNCAAHANYDGLCKHCVAVILQYLAFYQEKITARSVPESEKRPASLLHNTRATPPAARPKDPVEAFLDSLTGEGFDTTRKMKLRAQYNAISPVIAAYRDTGIRFSNRDSRHEPRGYVCLIPVLTLEDFSNGIHLSFFIRRKSEAEILNDRQRARLARPDDPALQADAENEDDLILPGGSTRPYVVKSLSTLIRNIDYSLDYSYGKDLGFVHNISAFDETSRAWLDVMGKYLYQDHARFGRRTVSNDDRYFRVSDEMLAELFDRFTGDDNQEIVSFWTESRSSYTVNKTPAFFSGEPFRLSLSLKQDENGIVTVKCPAARKLYFSEEPNYLYAFEDRELRRYPEADSKPVLPLIKALSNQKGVLEFLPQQRDGLFLHILPEVAPHLSISDPQKLCGQYGAAPMEGKILLDTPDRNSVTVTLIACYEGLWLNAETGRALGRMEEAVTGLTSALRMNWDAENADVSSIRRDPRAEGSFIVAAYQALALPTEEAYHRLKDVDSGACDEPLLLSDSDAIFGLLTSGVKRMQALGEVLVTDRMRRLSVQPPRRVVMGVRLEGDLLQLNIDTGGMSMDELRQLLQAYHEKRRFYRLKDGGFLDLRKSAGNEDAQEALGSYAELEQISQGLQMEGDALEKGVIQVPAFRALYLDGLFNDAVSLGCHRDEAFVQLTQRIRDFAHADFIEPDSLTNVLRPYQKTGYRWLRCLEACSFGGILADDMGLGKSVQLIAVLLAYQEAAQGRKEYLPSLIACPSSLVWNWKNELTKFAPGLNVRVIQGTAAVRAFKLQEVQPGEIVVTSYDALKRDLPSYKPLRFQYFAIDEAQYIKNHTTQAAKAVKEIVSRQRFALTGTPIENQLSELWSIFDFLMPGYLYRYARFRTQFEMPVVRDGDEVAKANLRKMILPFVLRRLKREVLTELPPKTTTVVPVELNEKQQEAYNAMLLTGIHALREEPQSPGKAGVEKMKVLALLTKLRRLCCDPSLCFDNFKGESAKLEACMELLAQAKEGEHRVLLFSQYTDMLDLLENRVKDAGMSYLRLQGSTPVKDRIGLVNAFNKGKTDVFLISLKAGGTGLNLTAADTVIHYDPWWNLAAQDQATDRAHRIGQERKVQVYKLIARNTIEERILALQDMKSDLAAIIESDGEDAFLRMSTDEIVMLLEGR